MDVPNQVRVVLATVFVGGLLATLVAGLVWAYTPVRGTGLSFWPGAAPADDEDLGALDPAEPAQPDPTADEPTAAATPTEDPDAEVIAAAADPAGTSVQVLDAGAGSAATQAAADALRELGYEVTNVTSARARPERTTIWYIDGREAEARALRARDDRFAEVGPNQGLNEVTDLHVLVAPDWADGP